MEDNTKQPIWEYIEKPETIKADELSTIFKEQKFSPIEAQPSVLPSAEEYLRKEYGVPSCVKLNDEDYENVRVMEDYAALFARHHVNEALKAASEKGEAILIYEDFYDFSKGIKGCKVDEDSIFTAYPLCNIK